MNNFSTHLKALVTQIALVNPHLFVDQARQAQKDLYAPVFLGDKAMTLCDYLNRLVLKSSTSVERFDKEASRKLQKKIRRLTKAQAKKRNLFPNE